jgi:hypothetical protein
MTWRPCYLLHYGLCFPSVAKGFTFCVYSSACVLHCAPDSCVVQLLSFARGREAPSPPFPRRVKVEGAIGAVSTARSDRCLVMPAAAKSISARGPRGPCRSTAKSRCSVPREAKVRIMAEDRITLVKR